MQIRPKIVALALLLVLPGPLRAAEISPDQATALENQFRNWLASFIEPAFRLPPRPVQLTPAGDHFKVLVPIAGLETDGSPQRKTGITADARPGENGCWIVSDIRFPSPARMLIASPHPDSNAPPTIVRFRAGHQAGDAVIDPGLGIPVSTREQIQDLDLDIEAGVRRRLQHSDRYASETNASSAGEGRLDLWQSVTAVGVRMRAEELDQPAVQTSADQVRATAKLNGVNRAQAAKLVAASVRLLGTAVAGISAVESGKIKLGPGENEAVRDIVAALHGIAFDGVFEESVDRLAVRIGDFRNTAGHAELGIGAQAPDGILQGWMNFDLQDLAMPDIPDEFAAYVPQHIRVRPTLSGVRTEDLMRLAWAATQPGAQPKKLTPELAALFAHGPLAVGLDPLQVDIANTNFLATANARVLGPQDVKGTARVTAQGFDDLVARVQADPLISRAQPFLVMARRLARYEDGKLVWDITFDTTDQKVIINGTDMAQITGTGPNRGGVPHYPPTKR
ncbi:MAG: hypothetical protein JO110_21585 [Acetobacteraceae bacterium]|nr:hypothetical protein [Acetobacteraceae bacterium]